MARSDGRAQSTYVPRKVVTRQKLMFAARALFVDQGFAHVSVSDIPKMAGVSQGTFYNHFVDKVDVFLEVSEEVLEELEEFITGRIPERPRNLSQIIWPIITGLHQYSLAHPRLVTAIMIDEQTLRPAKVDDPRIPDVRGALNWAKLSAALKGGPEREPTLDEMMLGTSCQFIIRSAFAFSREHGITGKAVIDRVAYSITRLIEADLERYRGGDVDHPELAPFEEPFIEPLGPQHY